MRTPFSFILMSAFVMAVTGCSSGTSTHSTPAAPITPTINWPTPAAISFGTALSSTQLNATATSNGTALPGTFAYSPAAGSVLTAGTQTLSATFTPTDSADYATANASVQMVVNKATPTITWTPPASLTAGMDLTTVLTATISAPGTCTYTAAASGSAAIAVASTTTLSQGIYGLVATCTPTDTVDYVTATATAQLTVSLAADSAVVDFGARQQVIRGFGGSEAWSSTMPSSQINALYGTGSNQLGLSIMRLRIAPATWNSSTKTADTTAWTAELSNGLAAQKLGATVFATPWTPPASMKSDSSVNTGSLNASSYADFANYLEAYVNYATAQGVSLYAISMQNEPDWDPCKGSGPTAASCYESCLWTAAQMDTWVANNASVLTVPLIMPESFYFAHAMSDTALNDPSAVGKISIIGGHLYGGKPYDYTLAESLNKDVWMTEHTVSLAGGSTATTQSITDAIDAAEEIHDSLVTGQYNAYVYWWLVDWPGGGYYSGLIDTSANPTFFGYALGQYSRFIRPGYFRYNATANPVSGVYVSAYAGNGHQVIVAINSTAAATSVPFYIQNATVTSMTPYETTANGGLIAQSALTVSGNTFTYSLPAQSITTFFQ